MDKFEKFLRSEMSARRRCELAEGKGMACVGSSSKAYAQKYFNMSGRWSFLQPTPLQPRPSRRPWQLLGERRSDK